MLIPRAPRYSPTMPTVYPRRRAGVTSSADATSIDALRRLGVTRVRYGLSWNNYSDPRTFASDRATLDPGGKTIAQYTADDLHAFAAAGISVLVDVNTPPAGMTRATGITAMPPFVAGLAAAFPGCAWEILNEMTSDDSFNAGWYEVSNGAITDVTRGTWYGQLLAPVYDAVKAADPTALVVAGGIDHGYTSFRTGLLVSATGKFDAFCVHAYGPPALTNLKSTIDECKSILGAVPLWVTEFGNQSPDDATQAADIGQCLAYIDAHCTANDRYYVYALISADGLGIVNPDGSFRHAAFLLRDRA